MRRKQLLRQEREGKEERMGEEFKGVEWKGKQSTANEGRELNKKERRK